MISKIKQIQGRVFSRLLTEAGIDEFNGPQGRILFVLWEEDDIPITRLSEETGLAKTTLTSMLDRMEGAGHIKRETGSEDRRSVHIKLTKKARNMREKYESVSEKMGEIFYKGFKEGEIKKFEKYLDRILENLNEGE